MMKKIIWLCLVLFAAGVLTNPLMAEDEDYSNEPWERAALYLGAFFIHHVFKVKPITLVFSGQSPVVIADFFDFDGSLHGSKKLVR